MRFMQRLVVSGDDPSFPTVVTYSAPMGAEELAELEEMLAIWIRGLRRQALEQQKEELADVSNV